MDCNLLDSGHILRISPPDGTRDHRLRWYQRCSAQHADAARHPAFSLGNPRSFSTTGSDVMEPLDSPRLRVSAERRREIARLGGLAAQRNGTAHRWNSSEAAAAARLAAGRRSARRQRTTPLEAIATAADSPAYATVRLSTVVPAAITLETRVEMPRGADSWDLLGHDGRRLQCRTYVVDNGFELCVGYPGIPLMYSDVYPQLASARRMLSAWRDAALAGGSFVPLPFDVAQGRPFDSGQREPVDFAQGRPFDLAQREPFDLAQGRPSGWADGDHAPND
jgi:hypothetical protein